MLVYQRVFLGVVPPPSCWGGEARGAVETHVQESLPSSAGQWLKPQNPLRGVQRSAVNIQSCTPWPWKSRPLHWLTIRISSDLVGFFQIPILIGYNSFLSSFLPISSSDVIGCYWNTALTPKPKKIVKKLDESQASAVEFRRSMSEGLLKRAGQQATEACWGWGAGFPWENQVKTWGDSLRTVGS